MKKNGLSGFFEEWYKIWQIQGAHALSSRFKKVSEDDGSQGYYPTLKTRVFMGICCPILSSLFLFSLFCVVCNKKEKTLITIFI